MFVQAHHTSIFNKLPIKKVFFSLSLLVIAQASALAAPDNAELAFNKDVIDCASYYQISSEAIAGMNVPQMKVVGERLANSSLQAIALAEKYQSQVQVAELLSSVKGEQLASLPENKSLAKLMGQYKDSCKTLLAEPQQRLDYWIMATM